MATKVLGHTVVGENDILACYDVCVEVYLKHRERGSLTKEEVDTLQKAYKSVDDGLRSIADSLYAEGLELEDSWYFGKWYDEDYFHVCGPGIEPDVYTCPHNMFSEFEWIIETHSENKAVVK